jgi:hypothetical protein
MNPDQLSSHATRQNIYPHAEAFVGRVAPSLDGSALSLRADGLTALLLEVLSHAPEWMPLPKDTRPSNDAPWPTS